jgi:catechol 2,3-dioxygenase-like lactoylglutathione lyase family enzyme
MTHTLDEQTGTAFGEDDVLCPTLHHVGITTTRFDEIVDFYGTLIGMYAVKRQDFTGKDGAVTRVAWLTNDRANHRLTIVSYPELTEMGTRTGYARAGQHIAFEYGSIDELFQTYKRLKRLGIRIGLCEAHGMSTNFYLRDPDGNTVELRSDNFGDWDKSRHFLATAENARGAGEVDFDKMIAAREAGATPEELFERALAGEFPPSYQPDFSVHR